MDHGNTEKPNETMKQSEKIVTLGLPPSGWRDKMKRLCFSESRESGFPEGRKLCLESQNQTQPHSAKSC
jgi:hypothetical protein